MRLLGVNIIWPQSWEACFWHMFDMLLLAPSDHCIWRSWMHFCPRGASRPRPWSQGLKDYITAFKKSEIYFTCCLFILRILIFKRIWIWTWRNHCRERAKGTRTSRRREDVSNILVLPKSVSYDIANVSLGLPAIAEFHIIPFKVCTLLFVLSVGLRLCVAKWDRNGMHQKPLPVVAHLRFFCE